MWTYHKKQKELITSLIEKGKKEQERNDRFAIIDFDDFLGLFTPEEKNIIEEYVKINPKKLNYKLPFIGTEENTNNLVSILDQTYINEAKEKVLIPCQYLP